MNVKSRYEVVLELENKKRSLIENKNNLKDDRLAKEKAIKDLIRQRDDTIVIINRKIDDAEEDLANFDANLVKDCLPDPPTPTSKAWPPGYWRILPILRRCSIAKLNNTNGIFLSVISL